MCWKCHIFCISPTDQLSCDLYFQWSAVRSTWTSVTSPRKEHFHCHPGNTIAAILLYWGWNKYLKHKQEETLHLDMISVPPSPLAPWAKLLVLSPRSGFVCQFSRIGIQFKICFDTVAIFCISDPKWIFLPVSGARKLYSNIYFSFFKLFQSMCPPHWCPPRWGWNGESIILM